jgi:hypothetical protein
MNNVARIAARRMFSEKIQRTMYNKSQKRRFLKIIAFFIYAPTEHLRSKCLVGAIQKLPGSCPAAIFQLLIGVSQTILRSIDWQQFLILTPFGKIA